MKRKKPTNVSIHLFILITLSILTIFLFFKFSTEDSYITYRYAQNIVDGNGFFYNPGEEFLGTTAPFYGLILAFFGFLGFSIPSASGILSALSLSLTVLLLYLLTLRKGYPLVGLLAGLFILLNPWYLQTFGGETYFQLLMVMAAFYFYDQQKYIPATLFSAFAFLARPDGIILVAIFFTDYALKNKKIPIKEIVLFILVCLPFFLFYYVQFHTFLPSTLEAKQAQYASGLWRNFLPGITHFAGLLVKETRLLLCLAPLGIIGASFLLFSRKIWFLIASWAILHTLGYTFLKVPFYHWYPIPLLTLLMLMSAFSIHFIISVPRFFKEDLTRKWKVRLFNQEIKVSTTRFKDVGFSLKWTYRALSGLIIVLIFASLVGGIKAYSHTYKSLPFPKLVLYTKAGQWAAENTPPDSSIAFLEVGYFGYFAQRKIIDLVGLVTPGVSEHIHNRDFQWAVLAYEPDYYIYNSEFEALLEQFMDQPWFKKSYKEIEVLSQPGYSFQIKIFKKVVDFSNLSFLNFDIRQEESNVSVGEITGEKEIGQTFYSNFNNLCRIDVMLATFDRENSQEVIFHLKKSPSDTEDIYTEVFNASSVADNTYRSFEFPPIPDSAGKTFYFSFESPHSKYGDAITIWTSKQDKYKKGEMYINRESSKGDLRFITYFFLNRGQW
ncbi:hypothetical protein ACFLQZ_02370 [Acidobacteriota bacterium]